MIPICRHLLSIQDLTREAIEELLLRAEYFCINPYANSLAGQQALLAFFEPTTRTCTSFAMAFQRLGGQVTMLDVGNTSAHKGETLHDTIATLMAMNPEFFVVRHTQNQLLSPWTEQKITHLINAGDGTNEHPTQALLDALTVLQRVGRLYNLKIVIVGDIRHSRVAHSNLLLWHTFQNEITLCGPPELMPPPDVYPFAHFEPDLSTALAGADVIITTRVQKERLEKDLSMNQATYFDLYGVNHQRLTLAQPNAFVMDPGPVIRDYQISSELVDDAQRCTALQQVSNGVPMRMAVYEWLAKQVE